MYALHAAYRELQKNGKVKAGVPMSAAAKDLTKACLVEAKGFARADESVRTRFAAPRNWTVENFRIPNGRNGVRGGLDKYPGQDCLMLGVWNDRNDNQEGDLKNARIYRTVTLEPGKYYFGAKYETASGLSEEVYMYAAKANVATSDIPEASLAFARLNSATTNGNFYGITFVVKKKQEVVLGFQADLTKGSATQEFRASEVELLCYGK